MHIETLTGGLPHSASIRLRMIPQCYFERHSLYQGSLASLHYFTSLAGAMTGFPKRPP